MQISRKTANVLGGISIAIAVLQWSFSLNEKALYNSSVGFVLSTAFPTLLLLSIVLPILAGWKASKLWFLMLLSPVALYLLAITHIC